MQTNPELWTYYIYICDVCRKHISKKDPVIIDNDKHYCSTQCYTQKDEAA